MAGAAGVSIGAGGTALGSYACRFDIHMNMRVRGSWLVAAAAGRARASKVGQPDFHVAKVTSGYLLFGAN